MVGSYITVLVVCAILQTASSLLIYSLCVAALSAFVNSRAQQLPYVVFMPGMMTILVFANIGLRGRLKTLEERRRAEAALQRANSELESFSYSIAHDLRSPLRGMNGYAQILLEDYGDKLDAEAKVHLEAIRKSAVRMAGIIDALLSLAGLSRREPKEEWVDLSDSTRASAAALAQANPERTVEVVVEDGLAALSDRQMFGTLIDNLLGNAWKFTQKASAPRIEFGSAEVAGAKALFVKDNGAGFDMAHAGKMFAPFQRLHEATEYPGYGIGLATVQRIVQRLGGRVWAEGAVNQGATFYFTLKGVRRAESRR
jgi:light-regulated signal transduction histidine kinase (bacteriophytochrome)